MKKTGKISPTPAPKQDPDSKPWPKELVRIIERRWQKGIREERLLAEREREPTCGTRRFR